ncbi:MAG: LptF/LptG family permease [Ghiorsea sp.]
MFKIWFFPFLGILCLVGLVFVIQNLLIWLPVLIEHGASLDLALTLFLSLMPNVLVMVVPIAYFFALQRTVAHLQDSSELDAMFAGGQSIMNIFRPVLLAGFVLTLLMLWITMQLAPAGKITSYNTAQQLSALKAEPNFAPKRFVLGIDDVTFYVEGKNADGSYAKVMFSDARVKNEPPTIYIAQKAWISNTDTGLSLALEHGDQLSGGEQQLRSTHFEHYNIAIPLDLKGSFRMINPESSPAFMSGAQLYHYNQEHQSDYHIAQWHNRLLTPLTVLILFCFAIPISLHAKRSHNAGSFFIAIALIAALNQSQLITFHKVEHAVLPWWSLWCLMLGFLTVGILVLRHVNRYGSISFAWKKG